jgi:hypothetical protein
MDLTQVNRTDGERDGEETMPVIFGLRFLEEEEAEIHDVVGCLMNSAAATGCDDTRSMW